ncbi:MAG TPA: PepSY domain-containing protein [Kribbellaceae bacterium]|nr:PepSY domain-containing protein [Kribbellaceae bacterium]
MHIRLGIGVGVLVAGTLAVGGVAAAASGPGHVASPPAAHVPARVVADTTVTEAQAREIALKAVPDGKVIEIELDDLADRAGWKVTLWTVDGRVEVFVDATTGAVTLDRVDGDDEAAEADDDADDDGDEDGDEDGDDHGVGHDADRGDDHGADRGDDGPGHH